MLFFIVLIVALVELIDQTQTMQCTEGLDIYSCQISRTSLFDEDISPHFYFGDTIRTKRDSSKKSHSINKSSISEIKLSTTTRRSLEAEYINNVSVVDYSDVADRQIREDHVTQLLQEMTVNTDSEITGLQATRNDDSEDDSEQSAGAGETGYFAFDT